MKRSYIGAGLLVFLCLFCGGFSWAMWAIHTPISGQLSRAETQVLAGAFTEGQLTALEAKAHWDKWQKLRACLSDHTPVEEIDAGFAELESYGASEEDAAFAAECGVLAEMVKALAESQSLNWWNLF